MKRMLVVILMLVSSRVFGQGYLLGLTKTELEDYFQQLIPVTALSTGGIQIDAGLQGSVQKWNTDAIVYFKFDSSCYLGRMIYLL